MFHPFEVTPVHLAYTILGAIIVLFGMFSLFIKEKLYIGEAVVSTLVGIIAGPYVTGGFNPRAWGGESEEITTEISLEIFRVVLALSVFATGVELPTRYLLRHWKSVLFLLGPCMIWGWFVVAAFIYLLVPPLSFLSSLVVASCLTPTDPILAQAVIGGAFAEKHVPAHIRHLLAVESGCNDGAAFPFLFIALYLTIDASDAHAVGEWFYITWLYSVSLGIILGALLGYGARKLFQFCERKKLIDRQSFVAQYVSLAVLSIGIVTLLGSDDLLAAFACGTAFAWDGFFNKQTHESNFSNVIDLLFNITCFIYIGSIIPFHEFNDHSLGLIWWKLVLLVISVVTLRRLPIMMALWKWIPDIRTYREALFVGHFGPMGVGGLFIANLASERLPHAVYPPTNQVEFLAATIQPIVHFIVLGSVLVHGLSIPFFSLGRRVHSISRTHSIAFTRTNDSRMSRMRSRSMDDGARRGGRDRPEPSWLSDMKRVVPGQAIVINRDDDEDEDGLDLKQIRPASEQPAAVGVASTDSGSSTAEGSGSGRNFEKEAKEDDGKEREFREGKDLVTETPDDDGDVDVSVDEDHFSNSGSHREGKLKHLMESRDEKERRLAREDEEDERKADEEHQSRRSPSPPIKRKTGGGVSMMRTATIVDGNEPEEASSDEDAGNENEGDRSRTDPSTAGRDFASPPRIAVNEPSTSSSSKSKKWKKLFGSETTPSSSAMATSSSDPNSLIIPTIKTSRSPSASSGARNPSIRFTDSLPSSPVPTSHPLTPSASLLLSPTNTLDGRSGGAPYQSILLDVDETNGDAGGGEGGDQSVTFHLPKPRR